MNWTELNALLKFEISATWNCKPVTANCGLRFAVSHDKPDTKGLYYLSCPRVKFSNLIFKPIWIFVNTLVTVSFFLVPTTIFTSTASDEALQGHVISTLNNTSAIDCFKLCLGTTHCESINLSGRLKMCELSGSTAKAQILEEREEFHLFKSPAHQAISL